MTTPKPLLTQKERAARRRRIAARCRAGATLAEVMAEFGVSETMVERACAAHGAKVARRVRTEETAAVTLAIVADLCNTADAVAAIGRRHGVSRQRVQQLHAAALAAGIPVRPR